MDFFLNAEEAILKENSGELGSFGERQKSLESKPNQLQAARLKRKSNHMLAKMVISNTRRQKF